MSYHIHIRRIYRLSDTQLYKLRLTGGMENDLTPEISHKNPGSILRSLPVILTVLPKKSCIFGENKSVLKA